MTSRRYPAADVEEGSAHAGLHGELAAVRSCRERPFRDSPCLPRAGAAAVSTNELVEGSMFVASSYPFLDVFWTILIFFSWVAWFMLLFRVFGDIFRRRDIGGGAKTLWLIFVIVVPFLGVFVYLIAESDGMAQRQMEQVQAQQAQMDQY